MAGIDGDPGADVGSSGAGSAGAAASGGGRVADTAPTQEKRMPVLTATQCDWVRKNGRHVAVYAVGTERGKILQSGMTLAGAMRFIAWLLDYYLMCDVLAVSVWDEWIRSIAPWDD